MLDLHIDKMFSGIISSALQHEAIWDTAVHVKLIHSDSYKAPSVLFLFFVVGE